jgi:hypothetical protein
MARLHRPVSAGNAGLPASHAPAARMPLAELLTPAGWPFGPPSTTTGFKENRMNTSQLALVRRNARLAVLGGAVLVALGATAVTAQAATSRADRSAAQAQLRSDLQYCNSGQSMQPRALCQREAHQAYNEALRGTLDVPVMRAGTRSTDDAAARLGQGSSGSQGMTTGSGTRGAAGRNADGSVTDQGNRTGSGSSGNSGSTSDRGSAGSTMAPNGTTPRGSSGSMGTSPSTTGSGAGGSSSTGSASSGSSGSTADPGQAGGATAPNGGAPAGNTGR